MTLWQLITQIYTGPFAHPASSRVLSRFSATSFAGRQSRLYFFVRENDILEKGPTEPTAIGYPAACCPESAKRCLSPVAVIRRSAESIIGTQSLKSKEEVTKLSQTATSERQRRTKRSIWQKPWVSLTKHWRLHRNNACAGRTISQMDAAKRKQEKAVQKAFICVLSRGALNPTHFKTIVEVTILSPKVGLSPENRSAKFLHWKFLLGRPGWRPASSHWV